MEQDLITGLRSGGDPLGEAARRGSQMILQRVMEWEVEDFLGRGRYQRSGGGLELRLGVFRTAEHFAREQKLSRSALFTGAVEEFLAHHRREGVTKRLNRVYASEASALDPVVHKLQYASLPKERW